MSKKYSEKGRTLLETLSVLVVMAILLLASVGGYEAVVHRWKKNQTVKAVSELVVRYKLQPITPKRNKIIVNIRDIYPEAERADAANMKTADTPAGRVHLEVYETDTFMVVVQNILDDSCEAFLEKGEYDSVLVDPNVEIGGKKAFKFLELSYTEDGHLALGKGYLKNLEEEQRKKVIDVICSGNPGKTEKMSLVIGQRCPKVGASYFYSGRCWTCPSGKTEDKNGVCCSESEKNPCGYCQTSGSDYCLLTPTLCHDHNPVCDETTKECVECTRPQDCNCYGSGLYCSNNHCCPVAQEYKNGACSCPKEGEKLCGTTCCEECDSAGTGCKTSCEGTGADHPCRACNETTKEWDIVDTTNTVGLGQCQKCDSDGTVAYDSTKTINDCGKCTETGSVVQDTDVSVPACNKCDTTEGSSTQWQWVMDDTNNSTLECGKCSDGSIVEDPENPSTACKECNFITGKWRFLTEPEPGFGATVCQVCKDGALAFEDEEKTQECGPEGAKVCCKECDSTGMACKTSCEGTGADHPCWACNETTKEWDIVDTTNTVGLEQCQKCDSEGNVVYDNTKIINDCGKCTGTGSVIQNADIDVPVCNKCDTTEGSSTQWQWVMDDTNDSTLECGKCSDGSIMVDPENPNTACKECDYSIGKWTFLTEPEPGFGTTVCQVCKDGALAFEDEEKTQECGPEGAKVCCEECDSAGTGCKTSCEGTGEEHPCRACNETTKEWDIVDTTNTVGLEQCQKCDSEGNVAYDNTKTIKDCGKCTGTGSVIQNADIDVPVCKMCDTTEGSETQWQWIDDEAQILAGKCSSSTSSCSFNGQVFGNGKVVYTDKKYDACCVCVDGEVQKQNETPCGTCGDSCEWNYKYRNVISPHLGYMKEVLFRSVYGPMCCTDSKYKPCPACGPSAVEVTGYSCRTKDGRLVAIDTPSSVAWRDEDSCKSGQFKTPNGCLTCPEGTWNQFSSDNHNGGFTECRDCDSGYYCTNGQKKPCDAGTYQNKKGESSCKPCPQNTYQTMKGQTSCEPCPAGTYQDEEGKDYCKCSAGSYFSKQTRRCQPCERGTYQDEVGQTECKTCPVGTINRSTGATECTPCKGGSFTENHLGCLPCTGTIYSTKNRKGIENGGQICCPARTPKYCKIGPYKYECATEKQCLSE